MLAMERAKLWATDPHFNEETQKAAKALMSSEQELLSAFGTELTFGTGGIRGVLGVGTNRMNEYTVGRATQGLSDSLRENGGKASPSATIPGSVPGSLLFLPQAFWRITG